MRSISSYCRIVSAYSAVRRRRAFTLLELLVALLVIGVLLAMLLPAVQSAREAARMLECKNHLKQIGLAWQNHHSAWKFFPTGGWGSNWAGDPDQGFDKHQPGGWAYNILPYLDERSIHDVGKGGTYGGTPDKKDLLAEAAQSVVPIFLCPSRRAQTSLFVFKQQMSSFANIKLHSVANVWRGDYCANAGDQRWKDQFATPQGIQQMSDPKFPFDRTDDPSQAGYCTGVSYYQSMISIRQITDGTSHKYMIGEKFLYTDRYFTGDDAGDNDWLWTGWNNDLFRTAGVNYLTSPPPGAWTRSPIPPQRDMLSSAADATTQRYDANMWGSPHIAGFNMVYCDGSVHTLEYGIDLLVHRRLHNRAWGY
jgi:prepilin-type N-terminal cleavage/methylation domain-containing protein